MLSKDTSRRVMRVYIESLHKARLSKKQKYGRAIDGTALVMFAIAIVGILIGLIT